jgi:hypothetical protein
LQGTSNHYAVIIQKYPPRQDPKLRPAGQIQPKVGFLFPDSNEELPHVTVTKKPPATINGEKRCSANCTDFIWEYLGAHGEIFRETLGNNLPSQANSS